MRGVEAKRSLAGFGWLAVPALAVAVGATVGLIRSEPNGPSAGPAPDAPAGPTSRFRNTRPDVAYVGDEACARCHADITATYREHPMGRSMAEPGGVLPEVSGVVFEVGPLAYAVERRDGQVIHKEIRHDAKGVEVAAAEAVVRYALGSGTRGHAFLVERDGKLYQSPIARYTQADRWALAPGYEKANAHFDRPIARDCLFCHTNQVEWPAEGPPVLKGLTIGCERCHGPGALHVADPSAAPGHDPTIVNPADLDDPAVRDAVCEQCHLLGTLRRPKPGRTAADYRPGLRLDDFLAILNAEIDPKAVGHVEQLKRSRCHVASAGRLACISCHDPHRKPAAEERVSYYRDRCLACHADQGCSLPPADRLARNPDDDCVSCHMPTSTATDVAHTTQTFHTILRRVDPGRPWEKGMYGVDIPDARTPAARPPLPSR